MISEDTEASTAEVPFINLYRRKFHLHHFGIANALELLTLFGGSEINLNYLWCIRCELS